ncbi:MAG: thioesterase family protein [Novosphingobium sp.]|nr:thioesterase family protein [Novosphingobium sp.]
MTETGLPDAGADTVAQSPLLQLAPCEGESWQAVAEGRLCVGYPGSRFLFGGTIVAGCAEAIARSVGLPPTVMAVQFFSKVEPEETITFAVSQSARKGRIRQVQVHAAVGPRPVAEVLAVAGSRDDAEAWPGRTRPDVPPPERCRPVSIARLMSSNLQALFELRLVAGALPDRPGWTCERAGRTVFWVRSRDGRPADRPLLAILGDFLALGISGAMGHTASGTSLDNHIRFIADGPADWVLCEIEMIAIADGLIHGRMHMLAPDGAMLAIASQTMALRQAPGG